jgi:ArsR family transcriptional regulator, arsenate/arsenite/antimonite-responsive transcriptional repressor
VELAVSSEAARDAAELLRVLADPTRLGMLATLRAAAQPVCICDFLAAYGLSQPTISHHMGKLRRAGLVTARKDGIWIYYQATTPLPPLVEAVLANVTNEAALRGRSQMATRADPITLGT